MSGRPTRVLHVIQNLNYGGMERVLSDIVRLADRERFESHVLCLQYLGRYSQGLEDFARLHLSPPLGRASMLWPRALAAEIRHIAPHVVHTHSGVWYKASLAARQAGVPRVIHTEHGRALPDAWANRLMDGLAARRTDVVVAVSEVLAGYLARALRVSPRKVTVVRNGVDTDLYRPRKDDGKIRRELGLGSAAPIVGSIGRLEWVKGYDVMIEAFALLRAGWSGEAPPVLVVAGEGAQRGVLEQRVAALGLEGAVHLLGWRDDPHDLHAAFTVFTLSSRSEGTSISLLEAMSAGLCPVVTDVGGNRAVLGEALEHRLVRPADPQALAEAWRVALADGPVRRRDACRGRDRVVTEFSAAAMVRAYETLYAVRGVPPSPLSSADRPPTM
jgi:glycosyltransferase involved in cell wall biosynthesis